jgi:hypothetical protein
MDVLRASAKTRAHYRRLAHFPYTPRIGQAVNDVRTALPNGSIVAPSAVEAPVLAVAATDEADFERRAHEYLAQTPRALTQTVTAHIAIGGFLEKELAVSGGRQPGTARSAEMPSADLQADIHACGEQGPGRVSNPGRLLPLAQPALSASTGRYVRTHPIALAPSTSH